MRKAFHRSGSCAVRWLAGAAIVLASLVSSVALGNPDADAAAEASATSSALGWVRAMFSLSPALEIDSSLRASFEGMAADHLKRVEPLLQEWARSEGQSLQGSKDFALELQRRMLARVANEVALWFLDSPGADYDEAVLPAIQHTGHCRFIEGQSYLARRALLIQDIGEPQRSVALKGEQALLSRWGKLRAALPARPVPSLREREEATIAQLRTGQGRSEPALPPMLASVLLVDKENPLSASALCALHQWGLARALSEGTPQRQALDEYRYAMMPLASDLLSAPSAASASEYPPFAAYFGVEGSVTMQIRMDAEGHFKGASVTARNITVPGIPGRPVAFETSLDEASLGRAAAAVYPKRGSAGLITGIQQMNWRLQ